ncbi:MAG TPA: hypothetical protein DCE33_14375, partial [Rhodospirillaceae bacterium]|nr:hypothetical protein [Rhodospirillaceae bacterium]
MLRLTRLIARPLLVTGLAITILFQAGSVIAATPPDAAKEYMHKLATVTLGILGNKGIPLDEREQKVRKLLGENLAINAMGRFVVGRAWRSATEEQRAAYQGLFEQFITLTYAKRLG